MRAVQRKDGAEITKRIASISQPPAQVADAATLGPLRDPLLVAGGCFMDHIPEAWAKPDPRSMCSGSR